MVIFGKLIADLKSCIAFFLTHTMHIVVYCTISIATDSCRYFIYELLFIGAKHLMFNKNIMPFVCWANVGDEGENQVTHQYQITPGQYGFASLFKKKS